MIEFLSSEAEIIYTLNKSQNGNTFNLTTWMFVVFKKKIWMFVALD